MNQFLETTTIYPRRLRETIITFVYRNRSYFFRSAGCHEHTIIFLLLFFTLTLSSVSFGIVTPISSLEELQKIGKDPNYPLDGEYELTNDIDASETINWKLGIGFHPIGTNEKPFVGKFDGKGNKITNLFINLPSSNHVGLFGYVGSGGIIQDIYLENIWVTGDTYVGGLIGYLDWGASVSNSGVSGKITGIFEVGGLVGHKDISTITRCYFTGSVYGFEWVGGLIGKTRYGSVNKCYAKSFVSGTFSVGGLIGENGMGSSVIESFATGYISGGEETGGFIGANASVVLNCYSTSIITRGLIYVGGLIGLNSGRVENCYATGFISGGGILVGGLIGGDPQTVTNSYWDVETTGRTISAGGEGKTTAEMKQQATYVDWDFANIWQIIENESYPYLLWQGEPLPETEGMVEGAIEGEILQPHSADQNKDWHINLSELLRVVQLYNLGEYHCDELGEDGYAPGTGDRNCVPHSADCNPQDWKINLPELLRLIQLYNIGAYYPCPNHSEDNYCPGENMW